MASLLCSSLLPPPPQPTVVLSFLSLTDPLFLSHNLLKLRPKWLKLSLSLDSLSYESLSLYPRSVSLSLSSLYLLAQWCMLIYGFVVYVDLGLWCVLYFDLGLGGRELQTNPIPQTISLVSNVSKLFRKLASRVFKTRDHCSKLSEFVVELESIRLEFL